MSKLKSLISGVRLLLSLRKGWGSKTVVMNRIATVLVGLDATWFQGDMGQTIVNGLIYVAGLVHLMLTPPQAVSVLLFLVVQVYQWLRTNSSGEIPK